MLRRAVWVRSRSRDPHTSAPATQNGRAFQKNAAKRPVPTACHAIPRPFHTSPRHKTRQHPFASTTAHPVARAPPHTPSREHHRTPPRESTTTHQPASAAHAKRPGISKEHHQAARSHGVSRNPPAVRHLPRHKTRQRPFASTTAHPFARAAPHTHPPAGTPVARHIGHAKRPGISKERRQTARSHGVSRNPPAVPHLPQTQDTATPLREHHHTPIRASGTAHPPARRHTGRAAHRRRNTAGHFERTPPSGPFPRRVTQSPGRSTPAQTQDTATPPREHHRTPTRASYPRETAGHFTRNTDIRPGRRRAA